MDILYIYGQITYMYILYHTMWYGVTCSHTCLLWSHMAKRNQSNPSGSPTPKEELSKYWLSFKLSKNLRRFWKRWAMKHSPNCRWFIWVSLFKIPTQPGDMIQYFIDNQPSKKMGVTGIAYWAYWLPSVSICFHKSSQNQELIVDISWLFGSVSKPCTPGEHQNSW